MQTNRHNFVFVLSVLLSLFVFRVLAQMIQSINPVSSLPAFEAWQSGALPYPVLLIAQVLIIAGCIRLIFKLRDPKSKPNPGAGIIFLTLGAIYFSVMFFRLAAGLSYAADHYWLGAQLPAIFHLVLASFLLTLGFYHTLFREQIIARASYPLIMILALTAHVLCVHNQVELFLATYLPVLTAATIITFLEYHYPERKQWQAKQKEVRNDVTFMLVVQVVLPRLLGFLVVIALLRSELIVQAGFSDYWPHHWSLPVQVMLMLLSAEFFRYWLHRLAHNWNPLWQFHAVHHSPDKLYWINVGRFHPIEKSIQYCYLS